MGERIGYRRVSTTDQSTDRQLEGIKLDHVFTDKMSGKDMERPELQSMIAYVRKGDHIYVHELSRLGRSVIDLHQIVKQLLEKDVSITFVKEKMDYQPGKKTDPVQELMFGMLASFAQFERSLIKQRQKEGIAIAKAKGKHLGRPILLNDSQREQLRAKRSEGATPTVLAKEFGVSRATIYNVLAS